MPLGLWEISLKFHVQEVWDPRSLPLNGNRKFITGVKAAAAWRPLNFIQYRGWDLMEPYTFTVYIPSFMSWCLVTGTISPLGILQLQVEVCG